MDAAKRARLDELRAKHRPPPPPPETPKCPDCGHPEHESSMGIGSWRVWCTDEACLCGVDVCERCGVRDRTDFIDLESSHRYGNWIHRCRHCGLVTPAVLYA